VDPVVLADADVILGKDYPAPIVDHAERRERALAMYGAVKQGGAASRAKRPPKARPGG
jgi:deoxyribodipyrimidine photo-lyase